MLRTVNGHLFSDATGSGSFDENFARIEELRHQRTALDQLAGVLHVQMMTPCCRSTQLHHHVITEPNRKVKTANTRAYFS